jgi:ribosome recycling factor
MASIHGDTVTEIESIAKEKMAKTIDDLRREMASIRTGRASVHVLDSVKADYYGTLTPISQMATISTPEPSLITVQPWDTTQIAVIEKAIMAAGLGLNPGNDGKLIRLPVPPLTEERRKEFVKQLHHITEMHRVGVRNLRRDANDALKKLEKDKTISEDQSRDAHDVVQKLTDETIKHLDEASASKEREIMEIG